MNSARAKIVKRSMVRWTARTLAPVTLVVLLTVLLPCAAFAWPNPVLVGSVATGSKPCSVFTQGHYAYVVNTSSNSLQVFNVVNPATPKPVGSANTGTDPVSVCVQGDYAYVVNWTGGTLQAFNVSNPAAPALKGSVATAANPSTVSVQGAYAYVTSSNSSTLQVFDVSNPTSPSLKGSANTAAGPMSLCVQGNYAYVANFYDNNMQIFNISNPASPSLAGSTATGNRPYSLAVQGDYAYVINAISFDMQIFNISNPASPSLVGSAPNEGYSKICVQGDYAYIATDDSPSGILQIFNVSNPRKPFLEGSAPTGYRPMSPCVQGNYAYLVNNDSNTLQVFNISHPTITSISPSSGPPGTRVTITGSGFGDTRGGSTVTLGGVPATVVSWSNKEIVITVPSGTSGGAVVVTTEAGRSNADHVFSVFNPQHYYLAEGTNAWGFYTYITIENPNASPCQARVTYMDPTPAAGKGILKSRTITLPALSQTTVSSDSDIGTVDFSTEVESLDGKTIAVDRTMYWTGTGTTARGYHSSVGTDTPSKTWYLPEGSSNWGFETWTAVLNPNKVAANIRLTYMTETGPRALAKTIQPYSRATWSMVSDIGGADASIEVSSNVPVVAERSMYNKNRREGSCSIGAPAPATDFYLSEGAVGYDAGFTTWVLVQNPGNADNKVTLTFQTGKGQVAGPTFTMRPNSRKTVKLNNYLPANTDVSTMVHGTKPLVAERAMYWDAGLGECFHASIGMSEPHMRFMCPDGQSDSNTRTYTLVQNPNPAAVTVRVTYLPQGGGKVMTFATEIPKESRATFNMADKIKSGRAAILVESLDGARPIMVERSMYGADWGWGTDTIGAFTD